MRSLRVLGLSPDGTALLLQDEHGEFELAMADVLAVRRSAGAPAGAGQAAGPVALTPRQIQERIRRGESAVEIADSSGMPVAAVARWEGPVLAERDHHAQRARRVVVGERTVEEHVADYAQRMVQDPPPVTWDSWQTGPGRWEVRARAARVLVRLVWDPAARRVTAVDDVARMALGLLPTEQDALSAVLRPMGARPAERPLGPRPGERVVPARLAAPEPDEEHGTAALPFAEPEPPAAEVDVDAVAETGTAPGTPTRPRPPARPERSAGSTRAAGRPKRASVPNWDDITSGFTGRPTRDT